VTTTELALPALDGLAIAEVAEKTGVAHPS